MSLSRRTPRVGYGRPRGRKEGHLPADVGDRFGTLLEAIAGDHTVLTEYGDRALLLCWPPLYSSLGECLTFYSGDTVALIGDGGRRTARLQGLREAFTKVAQLPVRALEP